MEGKYEKNGGCKGGLRTAPLFRSVRSAIAFGICLTTLPLFAGQEPQGQASETVEQSQQGQPKGPEPAGPYADSVGQDAPAQAANAVVPPRLTVPEGTLITARTSDWLSSDRNQPGDAFSATLQQPLVVDGWVVAHRGQTVMGRVAMAEKAGRVKGVSQLGVELAGITLVDGQQVPLHTEMIQNSGGTSKGRDAGAIGTTTGLGAAIGAAAGGGKGAGVGAGAGAIAGIVGVLTTRGRPTVIYPETVLTFRLDSPVTFSTSRSQQAFQQVSRADYAQSSAGRRPPRFAATLPYPPYPPPYYYPEYYYPPAWYWGRGPGFYFGGPRFYGWRRGWRR